MLVDLTYNRFYENRPTRERIGEEGSPCLVKAHWDLSRESYIMIRRTRNVDVLASIVAAKANIELRR